MRKFCKGIWTTPRVISLLLLATLAGCLVQVQQPPEAADPSMPDRTADSVYSYTRHDNLPQMEFFAKKVYSWDTTKLTMADTLWVRNYNAEGKFEAFIRAEHGTLDDAHNTLKAWRSVYVATAKETLYCDTLYWDRNSANQVLDARANVLLKSASGQLKCQRLLVNRTSGDVQVPDEVTLTRQGHTLHGLNLHTDTQFTFADMQKVYGSGILPAGQKDKLLAP